MNPAGQIGGEPVPPGQQFTYTVRAQGRLADEKEFGDIVVRANVRRLDRAHAATWRASSSARRPTTQIGRLNGAPAAIIAIYQLPGSNAIDTMRQAEALMEEAKTRFPDDLDYVVSLDTTLAVTEGIEEIVKTLFEALVLVIIVVFIFLQGFRATLIPLLAVPVSLVGTFAIFPLLGFSINTLSLFGLVLAIGLVVDDAIVVVEAVEHHIEQGLSPHEATFKAMEQVSGPVVAIALILTAVFIPTAFIPGITGRLYQQFAVTIAVSVIISAFNALTLSPALAALLLRPRKEARGPLGAFFRWFNRVFGRATDGYVNWCHHLIRKAASPCCSWPASTVSPVWSAPRLPTSFLPEEDQGYFYHERRSCPPPRRCSAPTPSAEQIEAILASDGRRAAYQHRGRLQPAERRHHDLQRLLLRHAGAVGGARCQGRSHRRRDHARTSTSAWPPCPKRRPSRSRRRPFPGVGTSGGVDFMLEDRSGRDIEFLAENTARVPRPRPASGRSWPSVTTTFIPSVPQLFADVDRDKVLKQGVASEHRLQDAAGVHGRLLRELLQPLRARLAGVRAGRGRRPARGPRTSGCSTSSTTEGEQVPLSALVKMDQHYGPE